MKYSVGQLAQLAGISRRTLRHYDQIGLLVPRRDPDNDYRYYDEAELLRLQQILFYRQLGLELREIGALLDQPEFSLIQALQGHRQALQTRHQHLSQLIQTVDYTLKYLEGKQKMSDVKLFAGFSEEQQEAYAKEAAERWDPELVKNSQAKWKRATEAEKEALKAEGEDIYKSLAALMERPVNDPEVQAQVGRWHQHLRFFYEPSYAMLRGLGGLYLEDERFKASFDKLDPGLAAYFQQAIEVYCDQHETEEHSK